MRGVWFAACLVAGSASAAEVERIVFERIGREASQLFVANADGSEERPLAADISAYSAAWAPDGRTIVFTSERDGSADLYRMAADGTGIERLTDSPSYDDQAAFSPDGRRVVFVSTRATGSADLWVMDLRSRKAHALTAGDGGDFRPAWSPDGKWIAFTSDRHSSWPMSAGRFPHLQQADIYLIRANGKALRRLGTTDGFCGSPKWSANGKQLLAYCMSAEETMTYRFPQPANGSTKLISIDVATGTQTDVAPAEGVRGYPSLLLEKRIAYVRLDKADSGIFYSDGSRGPRGAIHSPSWSADGKRVLYARRGSAAATLAPGGGAPYWKTLWSRDARYELATTRLLPSWHPSGKQFVVYDSITTNAPLMIVDAGTNSARTLLQLDRAIVGPQFSADGKHIVFGVGAFLAMLGPKGLFRPADRVEYGAQVGMVQADGSGYRQLTSGKNNNGFPSLSPDGQRIVYRTFGPEGQGLRIQNVDGGEVTVLTTEYDNFPQWSPRSDLIAFTRRHENNYEIFSIRPDGSGLTRLTESRGSDAHSGWSPDGEWLVFSSSRAGFKDEAIYTDVPQPYTELFVMRKDGTDVRQLTDNQWEDGGAAWQPH